MMTPTWRTLDFLKWWYLPETQLEYANAAATPPMQLRQCAGFEVIQPWFKAYKYMMTSEHTRDFWHEPTYSTMLSTQQEGFTAYASGQVNVRRTPSMDCLRTAENPVRSWPYQDRTRCFLQEYQTRQIVSLFIGSSRNTAWQMAYICQAQQKQRR
jgi:hypothetical protein